MLGGSCNPCCGQVGCCANLLFSGFSHTMLSEAFATVPARTPQQILQAITLQTAVRRFSDGTYVRAIAQVGISGTTISALLFIGVATPVSLGTDQFRTVNYLHQIYRYAYQLPNASDAPRYCAEDFLVFQPANCTSILKRELIRSRVFTPLPNGDNFGNSDGPLVTPPSTAGTFEIGLGTFAPQPIYIDGDKWTNINEVVVEISSELVGGDTIEIADQLGAQNAPSPITLEFTPLTYEFALQRVGEYSSSGTIYEFDDALEGLEYRTFVGDNMGGMINSAGFGFFPNWREYGSGLGLGYDSLLGLSSFDCPSQLSLRLTGDPSCNAGGLLYGSFTAVPVVPAVAVFRSQTTNFTNVPVLDDAFIIRTANQGVATLAITQTSVGAFFADGSPGFAPILLADVSSRLKGNDEDAIFASGLPATLSPESPFPLLDAWTGRIYGRKIISSSDAAAGNEFYLGENISRYVWQTTDQYVDIRITAKIVSVS